VPLPSGVVRFGRSGTIGVGDGVKTVFALTEDLCVRARRGMCSDLEAIAGHGEVGVGPIELAEDVHYAAIREGTVTFVDSTGCEGAEVTRVRSLTFRCGLTTDGECDLGFPRFRRAICRRVRSLRLRVMSAAKRRCWRILATGLRRCVGLGWLTRRDGVVLGFTESRPRACFDAGSRFRADGGIGRTGAGAGHGLAVDNSEAARGSDPG